MGDNQDSELTLRERVYGEVQGALDPDDLLGATKALARDLGNLAGLDSDLHRVVSELSNWTDESDRLLSSASEAHVHLIPRGWGISMLSEQKVQEAVECYLADEDMAGDRILMASFNEVLLRRIVNQVGAIGSKNLELRTHFGQRWRLLDKAKEHHLAQRYDASVPILLAQIEGLVVDLSEGKTFFSKHPTRRATVAAPGILAGIQHGLPALRDLFSEGVSTTGSEGRLSRHGILHGRELAYDTELVSAKCWSLLAVVAEWGRLVGTRLAEERNEDSLAQNVEISGVDESGAQLDRREFRATRDAIFSMSSILVVQHRANGKVEKDSLAKFRPGIGVMKSFPVDPQFEFLVDDDGQAAMIWRQAITGRALGYYIKWDSGASVELYYSSTAKPEKIPVGVSSDWTPFEQNPDWSSSRP